MESHKYIHIKVGNIAKELEFVCNIISEVDDYFEDINVGFRSELLLGVVERVNKIRLSIIESGHCVVDAQMRDDVNAEMSMICDMVGLVNNYSEGLMDGSRTKMLQLSISRLRNLFHVRAVAA